MQATTSTHPSIGTMPPALQTPNSSAHTTAPETSEERLSRWHASLASVALNDTAAAEELLKQIAMGIAPPSSAASAQAVFNDLIEHEAYELFVEVFNAYNTIRAAQVRAPGEPPFKSTLILQLPAGWAPNGPAAFQAALQKVRVQRLEVLHPKVDKSKFQPLEVATEVSHCVGFMIFEKPVSDDPQELELVKRNRYLLSLQYDAAVSQEVCHAIATLLEAGTTELVVSGNLALPDTVARAISTSQLLTIELGHENRYSGNTSTATNESYGALMEAFALCKTLRHLTLHRPYLLSFHTKVAHLASGCPNLESVNVTRGPSFEGSNADLKAFMSIAAGCGQLKYITVKDVSPAALSQSVLAPLLNLRSLKTLEIGLDASAAGSPEDWNVLPMVVQFTRSCNWVKHVVLDAPPLDTRVALLDYLLKMIPGDQATAEEYEKNPVIYLESLSATGIPISHAYLSALSNSLPGNQTLHTLNISGCLVSVQAAARIPDSVLNNETLRTVNLPKSSQLYFFAHSNKRMSRVHNEEQIRFVAKAEAMWQDGPRSSYEVLAAMVMENLFVTKAEAMGQHGPTPSYEDITAMIKAAPTAAQDVLDNKVDARKALSDRVGGMLQMAAPAGLSSPAYKDFAKGVVPYLMGNAKAVHDTVRLSEVGTAADAQGLRTGQKTPVELKTFVSAVIQKPATPPDSGNSSNQG